LLERKITERHARSLLALDSEELQLKVLDDIISKNLNVKQTEARVQFFKESSKIKKTRRFSFSKDIRLALNTIRQSVEMVSSSGLNIDTNEQEHDDYYEIVIKIPKNK
jgi:ParB family chromosome partitioning protein